MNFNPRARDGRDYLVQELLTHYFNPHLHGETTNKFSIITMLPKVLLLQKFVQLMMLQKLKPGFQGGQNKRYSYLLEIEVGSIVSANLDVFASLISAYWNESIDNVEF